MVLYMPPHSNFNQSRILLLQTFSSSLTSYLSLSSLHTSALLVLSFSSSHYPTPVRFSPWSSLLFSVSFFIFQMLCSLIRAPDGASLPSFSLVFLPLTCSSLWRVQKTLGPAYRTCSVEAISCSH